MYDLKQLYVTATSEQEQYSIDNFSRREFQLDESLPVEEYFRVSGYFGSYGPHMFAAAPKLLEALKSLTQALDAGDLLYDYQRNAFNAAIEAIAAANGESQQ